MCVHVCLYMLLCAHIVVHILLSPLRTEVPLSAQERCAAARYLFDRAGLVHEHGISVQALYVHVQALYVHATNKRTGHQWDYPNMWPPSAQMAIYWALFLDGSQCVTEGGTVRDLAIQMVKRYLDNAYKTLTRSGGKKLSEMYLPEKFDVTVDGGPGGGGEYVVQYGFGWTAAVVIEWLYYETIDYTMPAAGLLYSDGGGGQVVTVHRLVLLVVPAVLVIALM
eukprot:GHVS01072309.1.p1 GENE.GHVS01072309.1~~GHVS01072309.1.p1  ORF type:complete len:223 (-),score=39.32 GHVS01072309.1:64-732(-)